jgi:molybdopterin synthase sulfur carrier subunit
LIKIVLFANLRESLGISDVEISIEEVGRISDVIAQLSQIYGESWRETLTGEDILVAVNQNMVYDDHAVADGDEVAFFPPVTGG